MWNLKFIHKMTGEEEMYLYEKTWRINWSSKIYIGKNPCEIQGVNYFKEFLRRIKKKLTERIVKYPGIFNRY